VRITVFGAGYVGLVTATCLAELGNIVLCVDINAERVKTLRGGESPIYEPGLRELIARNLRDERLVFETKTLAPFDESEFYFVAVGTPAGNGGGADTTAVMEVTGEIGRIAKKPAVVVVKSTVPVGTCDRILARLNGTGGPRLEVVSNPEFLKEGNAVKDFFYPDRIVIGGDDEAAEKLRKLYATLQLSYESFVMMDRKSSELSKYASNAMLATRISFMNELARLCNSVGADIHSVRKAMGSDSRIGHRFLFAGAGYGGSCFPKDVQALIHMGRMLDVPMRIAEAAHAANEAQVGLVVSLITSALGSMIADRRIALWGLAFKPETDDIRQAPSISLAQWLLRQGATVVGHDPEASTNFFNALPSPHLVRAQNEYAAVDAADCLVLMTEWRCYRSPSFEEIRMRMRGSPPFLIDARNIWDPVAVREAGLGYLGIGRK
jgi:UDPglucose 6-dehydrogenase